MKTGDTEGSPSFASLQFSAMEVFIFPNTVFPAPVAKRQVCKHNAWQMAN